MKKTIKELAVIIGIIVILNVTGLLTEVVGAVQRVVLFTGIMNADIEEATDPVKAEYNFTLKTLDDQRVSFSDFKEKVVFVNLWATWCGPCIAEMPNIESLYQKVKSDEIKFVMITLDDDPEKARKFIEKKGFTFPVYYPVEGIPGVYRTGLIPTTHVISPDGDIIYTKKGTANYDTKRFIRFLESTKQK